MTTIQDPVTITICAICKRNDMAITDPESGEIICSNCGMVISDKIQDINRPEGRAFNPEQVKDRSRTGIPTSLSSYNMGLATVIGRADRDASGHPLDTITQARMQRLRKWDLRTRDHTSTERNLKHAFDQLAIMKDKLGLSDAIIQKTAYIYRKAQKRGFIRGRSITAVLAAAIYIACREIGALRMLEDITVASNIGRKDIAKAYRGLIREFDLKVPIADPMKCVVRAANEANLTENTKRQAISIINDIITKEISTGKDPMGIAATVLYISCLKTGEDRTQTQIANAAGVTDVALRNRFKELKVILDLN